jgi:hypothetical protein
MIPDFILLKAFVGTLQIRITQMELSLAIRGLYSTYMEPSKTPSSNHELLNIMLKLNTNVRMDDHHSGMARSKAILRCSFQH